MQPGMAWIGAVGNGATGASRPVPGPAIAGVVFPLPSFWSVRIRWSLDARSPRTSEADSSPRVAIDGEPTPGVFTLVST